VLSKQLGHANPLAQTTIGSCLIPHNVLQNLPLIIGTSGVVTDIADHMSCAQTKKASPYTTQALSTISSRRDPALPICSHSWPLLAPLQLSPMAPLISPSVTHGLASPPMPTSPAQFQLSMDRGPGRSSRPRSKIARLGLGSRLLPNGRKFCLVLYRVRYGAGRGVGPGAHVFRGPGGPVTNTSPVPPASGWDLSVPTISRD